MPFFEPTTHGYEGPTTGELCSFDSNGLTFSMRFGPSETCILETQILSFEVGLLENGSASLERKILLLQKYKLVLKNKELAPFVYQDIENSDQDGSRFSIAINVREVGADAGLRLMRKALMIMTVNGILSQERALPYFQYVACLQSLSSTPVSPSEAGEKLIIGQFPRARLETPQITG